MIKSYDQTLIIRKEELPKYKIRVDIYNDDKYNGNVTEIITREYTGLVQWDIISDGPDAEKIEEQGLIDPNHEYLVLHFNDMTLATFRNSYVDMYFSRSGRA